MAPGYSSQHRLSKYARGDRNRLMIITNALIMSKMACIANKGETIRKTLEHLERNTHGP